MIRHGRCRQIQRRRDRRVRRPGLAIVNEVVAREHVEHLRSSGLFRVAFEIGHRSLEEGAHPFAIEELVDIGADGGFVRRHLAFGGLEIERHDRDAAAAFQPALRFSGVRREAVKTEPQVGAKAGARRIVVFDDVFLERRGEEFLGQIRGLVGIKGPLDAQVLVGRLPVGLDDGRQRDPARLGIAAALVRSTTDSRVAGKTCMIRECRVYEQ